MKIAIIADTHFGATSEPFAFLDHQKLFYDTVFFPTLEKYKIDTVVHLGDLVDKRKFIDFKISMRMREEFLDRLVGKDVYIIGGNHDMYNNNTNKINAFNELLTRYDFKIYTRTQEVQIGNESILFVPWINDENEEKSADLIRRTRCDLLFGHLEIQGFEMTRSQICENGIAPSMFENFSMVFTGHFHRKSVKNNIYYLGSPFQMTWDDYGDARGFHIFDLETRELTFIENPTPLFLKYFYNDELKTKKQLLQELKIFKAKGCYCKLIVENKTNSTLMDEICDVIQKSNPLRFDIVPAQQLFSTSAPEHIEQIEDTLTLIKNVVSSVNYSEKKDLENLMIELYNSALIMGEENEKYKVGH